MARNLPGPTDRVVLVGATGTGKSVAGQWLLGGYYGQRQILVMDTKADPIWSGLDAVKVKHAMALSRYRDAARWPVIVYTPATSELNEETLDAVCEWVYKRGDTVLMIDEATQVTSGTKPGPGVLDAVTRGRVRHVSVVSGTQRPVNVPPILLTEAEWFYCLTLRRRQDRETVNDYTEDRFADRVKLYAEENDAPHAVGVYHAGHGGEIYPDIQTALAE